jgi:hypothetical protein
LPSEATPTGAPPATDARPRRPSARTSNPQASQHPCPHAVLTRRLHQGPEPLLAPHQPLGVFPLSSVPQPRGERRGRRREKRRRRWRAVTAPLRLGRRPDVDRSWGRQDGSRRAVEAGAGRVQGSRSRGNTVAGNIYNADVNDYTELATTTPPTQREHPAAAFISPPPWSLPGCSGGAETHRHVIMPECWPSSRRTAAPRSCGAPGPLMPLSPPSSCEESMCEPGVEA